MVMKHTLQSEPITLTIAAGEFKAKCLRLMDEANEKQQPITVTKYGKPVGHFVPLPAKQKPFHSVVGRSPGIKTPNHNEWAKIKAEMAEEWDDSGESLARLLKKKSKKSKQR